MSTVGDVDSGINNQHVFEVSQKVMCPTTFPAILKGCQMKAIRIFPDLDGRLHFPARVMCIGLDGDGQWWFKHPESGAGILAGHQVEIHSDMTITVTPSIQAGKIHGHLWRSVWTDC